MDMDIHKHKAITNNHELYLYLLRMCDLRTAKFGLVAVFLFFVWASRCFPFLFACGGLVGPRVTGTRRSWTALSCIILASMAVAQRPWRVGRETRRVDETKRDGEVRTRGRLNLHWASITLLEVPSPPKYFIACWLQRGWIMII